VLTGKPRGQLDNRIRDLRVYCHANKRLRPLSGVLAMGATTLQQLAYQDPFTSIVTPLLLLDLEPVDVRMRITPQSQHVEGRRVGAPSWSADPPAPAYAPKSQDHHQVTATRNTSHVEQCSDTMPQSKR
jgi:hypothetical protein